MQSLPEAWTWAAILPHSFVAIAIAIFVIAISIVTVVAIAVVNFLTMCIVAIASRVAVAQGQCAVRACCLRKDTS